MRTPSHAVLNELHEHRTTQHAGNFRRRDTIEQIIRINASATCEFLERFADAALHTYLRHLEATQQPRGRAAVWVRPAETPAACTATAW